MRSGVIAQKVGMTRIFTDAGEHIPVTVLKLDNLQVVGHRTNEKNGYTALQLGAGTRKPSRLTKADAAELRRRQGRAEAQARRVPGQPREPHRGRRRDHRRPLRPGPVRRRDGHQPGQGLPGRHEALELRRSARHARRLGHHRSHGSTGQRQDPGKVFKGKKMAGHMGDERVTTQNLVVVKTDVDARPRHDPRRGARLQGRLGAGARRRQEGRAQGCCRSPARSRHARRSR